KFESLKIHVRVFLYIKDDPASPAEVGAFYYLTIQRHLEPLVAGLSDVLEPGAHNRRLSYWNCEQQVLRVLDVVLDAAGESILHEAVVECEVRLRGFFPLEIRVRVLSRREAG